MTSCGERKVEQFIPTRGSLLSRLRNVDDHESWRAFFNTYWKLIYSFAVKCGCTDAEAEEAVQETVIAISKKMFEFRYDPAVCSFKGWLMHVTRCRVIDLIRRRKRSLPQHDPGYASHNAGEIEVRMESELEALWQEEWERNLVDAAMERVKRRANAQHFQIFHLYFIKKTAPDEIAELLGISRGQVYLAKHRVGALVRKEIKLLEKQMI